MSELQVTRSMHYDPTELALALQETFDPYLVPVEQSSELDARQAHLEHLVRKRLMPAHMLEVQPLRGVRMIEDTIDWVLNELALYKKPRLPASFATPEEEAHARHRIHAQPVSHAPSFVLRDHFQLNRRQRTRNPEIEAQMEAQLEVLTQRASDMMVDLRTAVQQFVGKDGWVMFFHRRAGRDIVIDRTTDFRIIDWERRMASGDWQ